MTTTYDTIHGAADALAVQLVAKGHGTVVLEPGNLTRYELFVMDSHPRLVALPDFGVSYRFSGHPHWTYVAEKLRMGQADAEVIAELLASMNTEYVRLTEPGAFDPYARQYDIVPPEKG